MAMRKIKKDDEVIVIAGRDKGKRGTVARVVDESRIVVTNINTVMRHTKPSASGEPGGILNKEMPLHVSNVAMFNPQTGKADRVGFKILDDGRKVRVFKSTKEVIDR
jgi:large subunit ribosomal protein L24